ncbi:MAG TPA: tripartite tricarboxylate transporter substrate binding protein [Roseomonas sp.]|jgi:tripartite-type tricarboxylate transporter receptor subunit TctC
MSAILRRHALLAPLAASLARPALAQDPLAGWPPRPVRFVVPFPPGGGTDVLARLIGQRLSEIWGKPVVVENRPGANGILGTDVVAKARPDGLTLGFVLATHAINPLLYRSLPYDTDRDIAPVTLVAEYPYILTVNTAVPANSIPELIALAGSKPGEISYASSGNGSGPHLAGEMLAQMAGIRLLHVPYRGAGPANNDLVAGQVSMMFNNLLAAAQLLRAGNLRVLAVGTPERSAALPDVPALAEFLPGFAATGWYAVVAPAAVAPEIIGKIQSDVATILRDPEMRQRLAPDGAVPVGNTPAAFRDFIQQDRHRWGAVIRTANVQLE